MIFNGMRVSHNLYFLLIASCNFSLSIHRQPRFTIEIQSFEVVFLSLFLTISRLAFLLIVSLRLYATHRFLDYFDFGVLLVKIDSVNY